MKLTEQEREVARKIRALGKSPPKFTR